MARGVLNAIGYSPVDHLASSNRSISRPKNSKVFFRDDGRRITTTIPKFCREIENNFALSFPRRVREITFPACEFNLVSHLTGETIAKVYPLSASESRRRSFLQVAAGSSGIERLKKAVAIAEPTILAYRGEKFGVLCPNDKTVVKEILALMKIEIVPE